MADKKSKMGEKKDQHGKKYQTVKQLVGGESVNLDEAIEMLEKTVVTRFDPTVEIHLNLSVTGIRGIVSLPSGVAKQKRILIITDENLEDESKKIEAGKIDFDILIVKPEMMPKIAKLAKKLGPRGLMPNPKSGTVTDDPKKILKEILSGRIEYKADKNDIVHLPVGKLSFGKEKLKANIQEILRAMPNNKVKSIFLNVTMGPSIRLEVSKLRNY